ncbi:hypothetical protein [Dyadobacter sp. CY343]|uniref:hypothetical protein n=1 Tax=Dyadobacter sp. CY343 TaxID=2907299 RepID=UPI001F1E95F2|nr:hypothetical protein [Dyadobacter sp. CY343]MCE7062475.1 hypothetical protein [Dyadobacter sp. CY343]
MKKGFCILIVALALYGCDSSGRVEQTKALTNEIKASQIKRVTNTQLVYSANEWGKKISQIAEKSLKAEIEKNPESGKKFCNTLDEIPVIAALQKEYGVQVELLGEGDLKSSRLAPKEQELLDAYLFSAKSKTAAGDNLQQLGDSMLVYNAPVPVESIICKTCTQNAEVPFSVWRLLFNKKDIIRKLDAKQLKK